MKKGITYLSLGLVLLIAVAFGGFKINTGQKSNETSAVLAVQNFKDDTYGVSVSYPSDAERVELSAQDKKDKIIFRVQQSESPEYLINIRAETGLRLPSQLARLDAIDIVLDGALKSLPIRFPEYNLISDEIITVNNSKAHVLVFTYKGPSGERIKQKLVLITKDVDTAIYITMQARESFYEELNASVYDLIVNSIGF